MRTFQNQTAGDLLKQTKRTVLDAYEHQTYTYGTLVRKLKVRRDPSRLPLIEVQFNLEKVGAGLAFSGLQVEVDPNPKTAVNFDLFLNVGESDQGLQLDCDYNTELFDRETLGRWLGHYETLLRSIAADATQTVDRLPLLTDVERRQIVFEANKTAADYPLSTPVHQIIEEQAIRTPEATAACFEHQNITYFDLDRRANQLARHLIQLGVRPGWLRGNLRATLFGYAGGNPGHLESRRGVPAARSCVSARAPHLHHAGVFDRGAVDPGPARGGPADLEHPGDPAR